MAEFFAVRKQINVKDETSAAYRTYTGKRPQHIIKLQKKLLITAKCKYIFLLKNKTAMPVEFPLIRIKQADNWIKYVYKQLSNKIIIQQP